MISSLRMTKDDPIHVHIFNMLSCNLSCVGSHPESWTVLASNANMLILFSEVDGHHMKGNRCNNNIYIFWGVPTLVGSKVSLSRTEVIRSWVCTRVLLLFQLPPKKSFLIPIKDISINITKQAYHTENLSSLVGFFFILFLPLTYLAGSINRFLCSRYSFNSCLKFLYLPC